MDLIVTARRREMALSKGNKKKVKGVIKGLNKAVKTHQGQAKTLKGIVGNGNTKKKGMAKGGAKAKRSKSRNR